MTDIDRIIAGLSEAQKRAILRDCYEEGSYLRAGDARDIDLAIFNSGLVAQVHLDQWYYTATDIGLAVRARLEQGDGS